MHGWRARIGLILPSANFTMEPDFYKMIPEGISVHAARMSSAHTNAEDLVEMGLQAVRAAEELKTAAVDILVFGYTSGSFLKGLGHDMEITSTIESATSIPTLTTSTAVVDALRACNVKNVSVASPYNDEINGKLRMFLEGNGFSVVALKGLGLGERKAIYSGSDTLISTIGIQEPYVAYKLVRSIATNDADGFLIPCTNFRTIEVIQMLEDDLGKPVISSNQASLAMAFRRLGLKANIKGFGSLFNNC